jgi:hypothetical protein
MNRSKKAAHANVVVDAAGLANDTNLAVTDLLSKRAVAATRAKGQLTFGLDLGPEEATAIEVR